MVNTSIGAIAHKEQPSATMLSMIHAVRKVARAEAPGQRLQGLQMSFWPVGAVDRDASTGADRTRAIVAVAERVAGH